MLVRVLCPIHALDRKLSSLATFIRQSKKIGKLGRGEVVLTALERSAWAGLGELGGQSRKPISLLAAPTCVAPPAFREKLSTSPFKNEPGRQVYSCGLFIGTLRRRARVGIMAWLCVEGQGRLDCSLACETMLRCQKSEDNCLTKRRELSQDDEHWRLGFL
ncbi:hypothetical protein BAUCODRAFT_504947 [Baudoinia panamericana UAMH 10762]|uniref:Uncharacterized protein n=1 Tax=Baudoinia panamericana (strain UAMH 10762) TaxID=717646 RepID=M2NAC3_BAUPA|nr:uncharacterized protein BAUCODRAFT_504947 [Baudoinia panamericana UAMH 10762]EMC95805.1 hypothetical protein BAUCODRAFT_504947 [Baudoinia panamericana UAMH 10762]